MQKLSSPFTYHAFFSYRMLRFVSLLFMTGAQISGVYYNIGSLLERAGLANPYGSCMGLMQVLICLGQLSMPFLLISVFTEIIRTKRHLGKLIIKYALFSLMLYLFYSHMFEICVATVLEGVAETIPTFAPEFMKQITNQGFVDRILLLLPNEYQSYAPMISEMIADLSPELIKQCSDPAYLERMITEFLTNNPAFLSDAAAVLAPKLMLQMANTNFFLDSFLCSVIYVFTCYQPRKLTGGKILLFRFCSVIPITYILISEVCGALARNGWISLSTEQISKLACSNPSVFILFGSIIFFIKHEDVECAYLGYTKEEQKAFRRSDTESVRFSLFISLMLVLISLFELYFSQYAVLANWGLGKSLYYWLGIPFVMSFSFTKIPRFKWIDMYIPFYLTGNYILLFMFAVTALSTFMEIFFA